MAGKIVEIKINNETLKGKTENKDRQYFRKFKVYTDKGNFLCKPESIKHVGFWDYV